PKPPNRLRTAKTPRIVCHSSRRVVVGPDRLSVITGSDPKDDLRWYLQVAREALLWKLEGLSEYAVRRPLTPTGTNLLGLVKHVASVELGYFGETFGRPSDEPLP